MSFRCLGKVDCNDLLSVYTWKLILSTQHSRQLNQALLGLEYVLHALKYTPAVVLSTTLGSFQGVIDGNIIFQSQASQW